MPRAMPTYADLSRKMNALLFQRGDEIAGIPIPLPGQRLVVESRHPNAELFKALQDAVDGPTPQVRTCPDEAMEIQDYQQVNAWYSTPERCWHVLSRVNGKFRIDRTEHDNGVRIRCHFNTMQSSDAWTLEAEACAWDRLEALIKPHLFKAYILTGSFLETSKRSGVTYIFRRLRPTVAIRNERFLAALCLHPVAYYADSNAGGLCPTDDVIAHLLLMRGDEHLFWRRANQHQAHRPEAGL
jgi:hypothetical protein